MPMLPAFATHSVSTRRYKSRLATTVSKDRATNRGPDQSTSQLNNILKFNDVGLRYHDDQEVLSHIELTINPREFVSVVGPSGCGKSTLLKLASGLITPTAGEVEADRDHVGYVFQDATLLPWRDVRRNVELLAELQGVSRSQRQSLVDNALSLVGLTDFQHHYPASLSGGMRMRASLARALTLQPSLFLFDEPFAALDEMSRELLNAELLELFYANRFAALFVTHSISEAVFLSSRVLVMSARPGQIIAEISVPFSYPRLPTLRFEPDFAHVAGQVSAALREEGRICENE